MPNQLHQSIEGNDSNDDDDDDDKTDLYLVCRQLAL